jgi:hypothetical protein
MFAWTGTPLLWEPSYRVRGAHIEGSPACAQFAVHKFKLISVALAEQLRKALRVGGPGDAAVGDDAGDK